MTPAITQAILLSSMSKKNLFGLSVFLLAVHAAVSLGRLICQIEDVRQLLFNGGDAARILAADHVGDLFRQLQRFFLGDLVVTDDIDGDVVVNVAQIHPGQCCRSGPQP